MSDFDALLIVAGLNLWLAWRGSTVPLCMDEGLWLLWGFTGAVPYRDHVDCKPPGIHLWCWLLARATGRRPRLIKFLHLTAIGGFAVAATALTGRIEAGLLFTALAQSAWLQAQQAWVEPLSAGCLMLALLLDPWLAALCVALAVAFNLKLAPSGIVLLVARGAWLPLAGLAGGGLVALALWRLWWPNGLRATWYGAITVARRMAAWRRERGQPILPTWSSYVATPLLLVAPAVAAALWANPDPVLWATVATYVVVNLFGRTWRPYHWIPLAVVAVAAPPSAAFVLIADWLSNRGYLADASATTRDGVARRRYEVRALGRQLRALPGTLWLEDEHTQLYIYARKRPAFPFVEQVEIRHVAPERRASRAGGRAAPEIVVLGPNSIQVVPRGYRRAFSQGVFTVLLHERSADAGGADRRRPGGGR